MKALKKVLFNNKPMLITIVISLLIMMLVFSLDVKSISGINAFLQRFSAWIDEHRPLFILWHIVLILAVYLAWGIKIDRDIQDKELSKDAVQKVKKMKEIKRAKNFRWVIIGTIILVDLATNIWRL